jgi:hypothetical protein
MVVFYGFIHQVLTENFQEIHVMKSLILMLNTKFLACEEIEVYKSLIFRVESSQW